MTDYLSTDSVWLNTEHGPHDEMKSLSGHSSEQLAELIVNETLNNFIGNLTPSSFSDDRGKAPIPYQGWYWRAVNFFAPRGITIAMGDGQIAVCQSNKWGYPERYLTDDEQAEFLRLVWDAYREGRAGGVVSEIHEARDMALAKAGYFIASLGGPFS
jgi:hypothetical protein